MILEALIASAGITLLSLIGVLFWGRRHVSGHHFILPAAVGVFLGVIFFELIPETLEMSHEIGPIAILAGFLGFYLLSHLLDTYHHHHYDHGDKCCRNGEKLLIGDAVHNFADGIVIASAFMIDPAIGVLTAIGVALHEIPQEIAEFGVLIHAGYSTRRAAFYNFLSATTVIIGTGAALLFSQFLGEYFYIITGIAAGNLLYIAAADLIPELRETHKGHFFRTFLATILGIVVIAVLIHITHGLVESH